MNPLMLHEFHHGLGARFAELNGAPVVNDYGDWLAEHAALHETAGVLDLSFRSRLCLVGADRARFLHGQVTNDVKKLRIGEGCYAAITTVKGKMESDLNIFCLADELLLDVNDLLPIIEAATLLDLARTGKGDVEITDHGREFAIADIPTRKTLFREAALAHAMLLQQIRSCLASKSDGRREVILARRIRH